MLGDYMNRVGHLPLLLHRSDSESPQAIKCLGEQSRRWKRFLNFPEKEKESRREVRAFLISP